MSSREYELRGAEREKALDHFSSTFSLSWSSQFQDAKNYPSPRLFSKFHIAYSSSPMLFNKRIHALEKNLIASPAEENNSRLH
jgi:hypothetical protein